MTPSVFIVDTNVGVAGLITDSSESPVASVLDAMLSGALIFLLSPSLLDEYRSVLSRREPEPGPAAPDRGDDHLWALLTAYPGSILVTGDRLRLENSPHRGSVISPATWLDEFANRGR